MADANPSFSKARQRLFTSGFIENRLPEIHPAFVNPPVHWDKMTNQYVPNSQALVPISDDSSLAVSSSYPPPDGSSLSVSGPVSLVNSLPPRPVLTDTNAMRFWNNIFGTALIKFTSDPATPEPKGRSKTPYSIRDKKDWDAISNTLELARDKYQNEGGPVGWIRKIRRKGADRVAPVAVAAQTAKDIAPQDPHLTPVLGAVVVLLDAVKQAASVRNEVLNGFEGLVPIFSDVELFLGTFPNDMSIINVSVELITTTLIAIEQAIGFFISNELLRGGKAILMRGEYEKSLLKSLGEINTKSTKLMSEATKSHIYETHMYSHETQKMLMLVVKNQQKAADGMNSFEKLLVDHVRAQDAAMERKDRQLHLSQQMNMQLLVENQRLRSASPILPSRWAPPSLQSQASVMKWHVNQETLRRTLSIPDLDYVDIAFILDKKEELPAKQRAQAEQIVNTTLFRNWIVTTSSAKLLVQWDSQLPQTIAEVSPLSVFCATMVQALQAKERFLSVQWFCGRHADLMEAGLYVGGRAMLRSLIDQLLREHSFDMQKMYPEIDHASLQEGQISELERLLCWLIQQLPQTISLICIIDGVVLYERPEHYDEAWPGLACLLRMTGDLSLAATVKVLFTSTPGPTLFRAAFEEENLILNVDTMPRLEWTPSNERMARELGDGLDEPVMEYQQYDRKSI